MSEIRCGEKSYKIVRELARGGMGIIYLAQDTSGRLFAVKIPRLGDSPKEDRYKTERIIVEGRILSNLRHPNIVQLACFSYNPIPVLVEEYVGGISLYKAYYGKPCGEKAVLETASQVLDAIGYIHEQNIIHRDINPNNVLETEEKMMKLIDFGTAKYYYIQSTKEGDPVWPVTPGFTAPEQELYGLSSPSSDIYSAAATLYFLCTGRNPRECIKGKSLMPPSELNGEISDKMSSAILIGLDPNPSLRYPTAKHFLKAVQGIALERPYEAHLIVGSTIHEIGEGVEIGRLHPEGCPSCKLTKYKRIDIDDPFRYVGRHHAVLYRRGPTYAIEFIGKLNAPHVIYMDHLGKPIVKRIDRGKSFLLSDGDQIALCYDDRLGPYMLIRFENPAQRKSTGSVAGGAHGY